MASNPSNRASECSNSLSEHHRMGKRSLENTLHLREPELCGGAARGTFLLKIVPALAYLHAHAQFQRVGTRKGAVVSLTLALVSKRDRKKDRNRERDGA